MCECRGNRAALHMPSSNEHFLLFASLRATLPVVPRLSRAVDLLGENTSISKKPVMCARARFADREAGRPCTCMSPGPVGSSALPPQGLNTWMPWRGVVRLPSAVFLSSIAPTPRLELKQFSLLCFISYLDPLVSSASFRIR